MHRVIFFCICHEWQPFVAKLTTFLGFFIIIYLPAGTQRPVNFLLPTLSVYNIPKIPLYIDELIESVQRKALKIIFGRVWVDYTEALVLAGLESRSDRRVGACKWFMAAARQMSPLKNIIPSPAAIESHYSIRVQLPRRQHGHTRRINDFATYNFSECM